MEDINYLLGRWLSSPLPGEEVIISGMSGKFPNSDNIQEFSENLLNKIDMITENGRRWNGTYSDLPPRSGYIYDIDKLDAGYFGLHYRQAHSMNSIARLIMESVIEAIFDAGINPSELEGTRTGVFLSVGWTVSENDVLFNTNKWQTFPITGNLKSAVAHRISYFLKLKGPSYNLDTACSSSFNGVDHAFKAIRSGVCDNAIISAGLLLLDPRMTRDFFRGGVISPDGRPKVFDQNSTGYVRAETIASLFLQKSKNSRKIYAKIINTKLNSHGYKGNNAMTFPSMLSQKALMTEIYNESGLQASDLSYFECHATGTQVGDPQEAESVDLVLAQNRKRPLLVGSVKSNMGHSEHASGLSSIIKVILAMESGKIGPNINFEKIKEGLIGFEEGRMVPVVEVTDLENEQAIVGVNNFGFGGSNGHVILQRISKARKQFGLLENDLPVLVCASGRSKEAVQELLNSLNKKNFDREYYRLIHQIYQKNIPGHLHRGFGLLGKNGLYKNSCSVIKEQLPRLYLFFGDFGLKAKDLLKDFVLIPFLTAFLTSINKILASKNLNIMEKISNNDTDLVGDEIISAVVQLCFVVVLKEIQLECTAVYGNSLGKLIAAFYYNTITLEEVLAAVYNCGQNRLSKEFNCGTFEKYDSLCIDFLHKDNLFKLKNSVVLNVSHVQLGQMDFMVTDFVKFLEILGRLYMLGFNFQIDKIYPKIEFPVSRGTPILSPLIKWNHKQKWNTYKCPDSTGSYRRLYKLSYAQEELRYMQGHVIDNRNLIPATKYLQLVWYSFAEKYLVEMTNFPVVFENCKFLRAAINPKDGSISLLVTIEGHTGNFEIRQNDLLLVNGRVSQAKTQILTDLPKINLPTDSTQILNQDEIYRELNIRGYNYSGLFKGLVKCNIEASFGFVKWLNDWAGLLDCMLQMKILQLDSRLLFVPIGINRLVLDPVKFLKFVEEGENKENTLIPVFTCKQENSIRSEGIGIWGLNARSIERRKQILDPVLEKYVFVPNIFSLEVSHAVRVNTQIILENATEKNFKAVEITDDFESDKEFLLPFVCQCLDDTPLVNPVLTISTKKTVEEIPGIKIEEVVLTKESNFLLIIATKIFKRPSILKMVLTGLSTNGYLLSRENLDFNFDTSVPNVDLELLTEFTTEKEKLILSKKRVNIDTSQTKYIKIDQNLEWLPLLQNALKEKDQNIVIYGQNIEPNGILGLTNAIRREPGGNKIKSFFTFDQDFHFDLEDFSKKTEMSINIFKNYQRGTYRHLPIDNPKIVASEHCFVKTIGNGDFSGLKWLQGPLTSQTPVAAENDVLVQVHYSSLNFKDIIFVSGRLRPESLTTDRLKQDNLLGWEFSGITSKGKRVAGIVCPTALSTLLVAQSNLLLNVPDNLTLEEAATVPLAYITVVHALFFMVKFKPGASILIHSATGGVGLAAINICRYFNCKLFLTVGSQEKRNYIKQNFPEIPDTQIGSSRDTSFEEMVLRGTKSRGVDIVINSLVEDKLIASVRCLAYGGHFVEIGRFDMANDTLFNTLLLEKSISFHGINLDKMNTISTEARIRIMNIIAGGIHSGFIKPLPRVIYKPEEVEQAFRFMATGNHIGKVLIIVKDEEKNVNSSVRITKAIPRFNGHWDKAYVIIGGLGGFGLELADWLVLRGAKKLVLGSRSDVNTGYQSQRIGIWKSYGVNVQVFTDDVATYEGCVNLIKKANNLGPVEAVFNLAARLEDGIFENQTPEMFKTVLAPKALATKFLDVVTKELCPQLRYFVVFSSVSCGRGNPGQTNYALANAIMERICEKRKSDGLPGLAIQWGAVGEVGLVAKMQKENKELVIGGTLQQRISSCFEALDKFLFQDSPVVSSMLVAVKNSRSVDTMTAVEVVATILGIQNVKKVDQNAPLSDLGLNSLAATEIIQVLEVGFGIYVNKNEINSLTFAKLAELEANKGTPEKSTPEMPLHKDNFIIQQIPNNSSLRDSPNIVKFSNGFEDDGNLSKIYIFPGIEGAIKQIETFAKQLKTQVYGVQYSYNKLEETIEDLAKNIFNHIESQMPQNGKCIIIGYSFGVEVGLETLYLLENKGYNGRFVAIEGSPDYLNSAIKTYFPPDNDIELETALLHTILKLCLPKESLLGIEETLSKFENLTERIDRAWSLIPSKFDNPDKEIVIMLRQRIQAVIRYEYTHPKIRSLVHLFKAKLPMVEAEDDFGFSKICQDLGGVEIFDGDHSSILNQTELVDAVNKLI